MDRKRKGPPKKDPKDLLRRLVHVTLNDRDYLGILEAADAAKSDVGPFIRKLIKRELYGTENG